MNGEIVPLKHLVGINERALAEDTDPDREFRYIDIGVVGRGELVTAPEQLRFGDAPSRARRIVRLGDTIVSTVRTYLRSVWPVSGDADRLVVSTGFAVLTPHRIDARFFSWWARSDPFIEEVVARSVGVSYPAINAVDLGELLVRVPHPVEQRAIADFLDTETARIDALITKKRRMIDLLLERRSRAVSHEIWSRNFDPVRLKHLCGLPTSGNRDHSSFTPDDDGVPCLRGLNVRPGRIEMTSLLRISIEDHQRLDQTQLQPGDLVIVRSGNAGSAAVIPPEFGDVNCVDLVVVRSSPRLNPRYLEYVVNSREAQEQVHSKSAGALLTHFNAVDAGDLTIPWVEQHEQERVVVFLNTLVGNLEAIAGLLKMQLSLLRERRQALITAAVTGDLDVPGAAA